MKTTWPLVALLACSCATSTDRAVALRDQYRKSALDPVLIEKCRAAPEQCGGYAGTYWSMPLPDVARATGCVWNGEICANSREQYVFRSGHLTGVLVGYPEWAKGRSELVQSLGEPGWEGSNVEGLNSRLDEARRKETAMVVFAALGDLATSRYGFAWFAAMQAHEERRDLEAKQAATTPMHCASWNTGLTRVLLCDEDGLRTRALFTSRADPETANRVGAFVGLRGPQ